MRNKAKQVENTPVGLGRSGTGPTENYVQTQFGDDEARHTPAVTVMSEK
jgi:hypothetical protein